MNILSYPFLLLVFFLLANLVLGLIKGRGVKTVSDFALGNKNWGGISLFATLSATVIAGNSFYGFSKDLVHMGIFILFTSLTYPIQYFLSSFIIPTQVAKFKDCITFGDFIGKLYGSCAKSFCGLISGLLCSVNVILHIQLLGLILNQIFGFDHLFSIVFSAVIISIYTTFGGMRSVVSTDIFQFLMICFSLFVLLIFVIGKSFYVEGFNIFNKIPTEILSCKNLDWFVLGTRIFLISFLVNITNVPEFQRVLMSDNNEACRKMYRYTSFAKAAQVFIVWVIVLFAIGLLGKKTISGDTLNIIIHSFIPAKVIPFLGIGLISVVFSTADSYLHSSGLLLSKDFLEPLLKRDIKLLEVRIITFFVGILSMLVVLWFNGWFNTLLKVKLLFHLEAPILAVPVLYGFLGFQSSSKMFWSSAISGFLGLLIFSYVPSIQSFKVVFGCLISLIAYFTVHYYENKGFKFIGNPILPCEKD